MRLLLQASRRHYLRHPWQLVLAVIGIALGVAVFVAVEIASGSAQRAFGLSMDEITGTSTHRVVGTASGLDESIYAALRLGGIRPIAPVVEAWGRAGDETLHLLGVDPLAEGDFRGHLTDVSGDDSGALMGEPDTAYLAAPSARRLGIDTGDDLELTLDGRTRTIRIIGTIGHDEEAAIDGVLVADIATVQEIAGLEERLAWIDIRAPEGTRGAELLEAIAAYLPPSAEIVPAQARSQALSEMSRAFHTNLTAMSLLALLVGMFLIFNTMSFAVVQRRAHIACLRLVGATRTEVMAAVLFEALVIGAAATALGLLAGIALAEGLLALVTRTINDLYFTLAVRGPGITASALLGGAALGIGGTLAAAFVPAREAASIPPRAGLARSSLESRSHAAMPRLALAGIAALVVAGGVLAATERSLVAGFAGLFLVILGMTFLSPMATVWISRLADRAFARRGGVIARLATRGIADSLSRTGVALAALMLAVTTVIGVALMIASFRAAVAEWLDSALQADIFIAAQSSGPGGALDDDLVTRLVALPGVTGHSLGRTVTIESGAGLTEVFVLGLSPGLRPQYPLLEGDPTAVWGQFGRGEAIAVSEPFAWQRGVAAGDDVELRTDRGTRAFRVAGVFHDYTTGTGRILMPRALYERWYDDRGVGGVGLYLEPDADLGAAIEETRAAVIGAASDAPIEVRSNRALRALSMEVFDRTFTITEVLRLLAVAVAIIGIVSALMALQLERGVETGVLRSVGLTPGNVFGLVTIQTALMGAIAGLIALPTGWLLAQLLIHVINVRSFGWSMPALTPPAVLASGFALAVGAAVAASLYPAWRMSRTSPAAALRNE